jgi:hypothetical protein
MKIQYSYLLLLLVMIGCSNKDNEAKTIPIDKMKVVVWQLMNADEHYARISLIDSNWRITKKNVQFYQQIFDLNKIDRVAFYQQIDYLKTHPEEFKILMDSVTEFSKREKKVLVK